MVAEGFFKMSCGGCGIEFHVPDVWHESKRRTYTDWSCPNGCTRRYMSPEEIAERDRPKVVSLPPPAAPMPPPITTSKRSWRERLLLKEPSE